MGLDNFWKKNKDEYGIVKAKLKVCGSMLNDEDDNNDSFRGKVYHRFIEDVCNENLYVEMIPNETVKQMADDLEATEWRDSYIENYDIEEEEFKDLVKMFRLHADAGHYLVSSW
jgi:hypothetical protein